jgi:methionyl-tRNA formyltransferase
MGRLEGIFQLIKFPRPNSSNSENEFNLAVVVSFGYFLPVSILRRFKLGTLNVHPSLLPKYRGSSPIQYSILNRDKSTGISIIDLNPDKFDAGKVLNQTEIVLHY